MSAAPIAMFASRAFGTPMMDLAGFDTEHIDKELVDARICVTRRALPLYKRGNRLFVAVSDPANLQALDEVRFKTNLVVEAVVDEAPLVRYLQKILVDAIGAGVSDIHLEPYEKFYRIRYRLDGQLMEVAQPPLAIKDKMASRIKVISRLDISEKRVPQDGRMKLVLSKNRVIDFRVSTLPTLYGEKIVLRILDPSSATLGVEALGYEPE